MICPKCGSEGRRSHSCVWLMNCGSRLGMSLNDEWKLVYESHECLRLQLYQAEKRISALEKVANAAREVVDDSHLLKKSEDRAMDMIRLQDALAEVMK